MSGNPFRRNVPGNVKLQAEEKRIERTPSPFKIGKKEKRVKIQTPPQSPEEPARRLSAGRVSPPPPERTSSDDDDGSDTTATADSDIEQAFRNTRRNSGSLPHPDTIQTSSSAAQSPAVTPGPGAAPYNPFARTLATSEAAFGLQKSKDGQDDSTTSKPEGGKKGMDVDMFKNILMTGSPAPTPPQTQQPQDSSSNTDASSVSKHSLFDQTYNLHPESPRSSFDHVDYSDDEEADDENEKGGLMGGNKERLDDFAPPAPPKPGQLKPTRGPQTVSFAHFDDSSTMDRRSQSPANAALAGKHRPPMLHRTDSDLNKPLPKTPPRSPGLPQEQPPSLDTQMAQVPQPPTPTVTSPDDAAKKAPPPPPSSRRAGQAGTSHNRARSTSDATQEAEQDSADPQSRRQDTTPKSTAPPPPPSRKSKPASHAPSPAVSTPASETPPTNNTALPDTENKPMQPPPAPAPRRNPSTKTGSIHRSPSNASHTSSLRHEAQGNSAAPPIPPPPRRAAGSKRESLDGAGAANSMSWAQRRSSQNSFESARSSSLSKPRLPSESEEADTKADVPQSDILADMSAFQAEIDALRRQTLKGG